MAHYFVLRADGNKEGAYEEAVIRQMVATGQIKAGDKLEDAQTGSIWEPSIFAPATGIPAEQTGAGKKKSNPLVWVLVGLCVVCIPCIAVFAAVLFPVFSQARVAAKQTKTMNDLKQVGMAVSLYGVDFDDKFPLKMNTVSAVWPALRKYAKVTDLPQSQNQNNPEFNGNSPLAATAMANVAAPPRTYEFFDSAAWPNNRRNVVYVDTHVKRVPEATFTQAMMNGFVEK